MGASPSQVTQSNSDNSDDAIMRQIATSEGPSGVGRYIEKNIDRWKNETVKFGIIGRSGTGKSSFVNLVRDLKKGDVGYAKVGCGNTTRTPTSYFHPKSKQIVYWDLPGVGTLEFPKANYIEQMKLHEYDYFFVFFDKVLEEVDLWVAEQLIKMRKPFCLVRSKLDKDVEDGNEQGIDGKTVISNLRTEILNTINNNHKNKQLRAHCKLFLISCVKKRIGEIDTLFQHIRENLSSIKFEAVVYSLSTLSQEVIEEKYKTLQSRVNKASLGTALIAASPIPGLDAYANIEILVNEIKHYVQVFGLTSEQIRKISYSDQKQLKCIELFGSGSDEKTYKIVKRMFIEKYVIFGALSISDIFLPIVGSVISAASTATIVYSFLNEILENLQQDAIFIYDLILPSPERIIGKLQVMFDKEGLEGTKKYICYALNRWKDETVTIGVIGEPSSGKMDFINLIRRLKKGNSGLSRDNKNTTQYYHLNNERIVFIETDLPGSKELKISYYDAFFVFLNGDIHTDNISIVHNLTKIEKCCSVTRTMSAQRQQDHESFIGRELSLKRDEETDIVRPEPLIQKDSRINLVKPELIVKREDETGFARPKVLVKRGDQKDSSKPELLVKSDDETDSVKPELLVKRDDQIDSVKPELSVKRDDETDSVKPELSVKRDDETDSVKLELSVKRDEETDSVKPEPIVKSDDESDSVKPELLVNRDDEKDSVKPELIVKRDDETDSVKPEILVKGDDETDSVKPELSDERDDETDSVKPELSVQREEETDSVKQETSVKTDVETDSVKPELLVKKDEEIDSVRLREILCSHMYKDIDFKNDVHLNMCVLSCFRISISEVDELIHNLVQNLPQAKSDAFLNGLHPLSKLVIEEKFQSLKKRIVCVTIAATPTKAFEIPSVCFPVIMHILVDEITHYIKVFGFLDRGEEVCRITKAAGNELLCRELLEPDVVFSDIINRRLKVCSKDSIRNIASMFLAIAGTVVSSAYNAAIVFKCLTQFLNDLKHDAFVVHDRVLAEKKSS